jgi:hypothetical protein
MAFDQSGPRWLGISDLIAEPEGPTFISYKVARSLLNRLRFVTQDPQQTSDIAAEVESTAVRASQRGDPKLAAVAYNPLQAEWVTGRGAFVRTSL